MSDTALVAAVNSAAAESQTGEPLEALVIRTSRKFVNEQLDRFPRYCYEARKENYLLKRRLADFGNPEGWSESKNFKLDFVIPRSLYMFMVNLVYKEFWAEANERVWRKFMVGICRGDDPMDWLKALKIYYGKTSELQKTGDV